MSRNEVLMAGLIATGLLVGCTPPPPPTPTGATTDAMASGAIVADVVDVNRARRQLTLRGPDGREATISAPSSVRNFDQIRVGDRVLLVYRSLIEVQVAGAARPVSGVEVTTGVSRAQPGQRPAGVWGISTRRTVQIVSVDRATHTVVFREPDGTLDSITVQNPANYAFADGLLPGTNVLVTVTDAIAGSVEPVR